MSLIFEPHYPEDEYQESATQLWNQLSDAKSINDLDDEQKSEFLRVRKEALKLWQQFVEESPRRELINKSELVFNKRNAHISGLSQPLATQVLANFFIFMTQLQVENE